VLFKTRSTTATKNTIEECILNGSTLNTENTLRVSIALEMRWNKPNALTRFVYKADCEWPFGLQHRKRRIYYTTYVSFS
jgi:hypothetical protein